MIARLVSTTMIDPEYAAELLKEFPDAGHVADPEGLMAYIARVSSPNQANPSYANLLKYCASHGHWSVFQMIDVTFEIVTSRAIAQQILRHSSFAFQEFSQRYGKATATEKYRARRQDVKNRQNSIDDLPEETKVWFDEAQETSEDMAFLQYKKALSLGIAKECARMLLPLSTQTKLYMKGSLRSWIHYLETRCAPATQFEHREIALAIREVMAKKFPHVAEAVGWKKE